MALTRWLRCICAVAALVCGAAAEPVLVADVKVVQDVFACNECVTAEDCHVSLEWQVWVTDGHYVDTKVNATRVCIKRHLVGCNGPTEPAFCDSTFETCAASDAFFDERARTAPHSVCSRQAHQTSTSYFLAKTLPVLLASGGVVVLIVAAVCAYKKASMQPLSKLMMLLMTLVVTASYFTFWSPFLMVGVGGVAAVVIILMAHSQAVSVDTTKHGARRWLLIAFGASMLPVAIVYLSKTMFLHALGPVGGSTCSSFYDGYFEIDPRLLAASHNAQVKYHSLCSRGSLARAVWNASAVVFLSCLVGTLSLVELASKHQSLVYKEDQEREEAEMPSVMRLSPTSRDDPELPTLTIVKAASTHSF